MKKKGIKQICANSISSAVLSAAIIFIPAFAMASGGEGHADNSLMSWVWRLLNFGILVFILVKFLGKPMRSYFQERKELIEKSIRESKEAKELAVKALAEVEERLKVKDSEIQAVVANAEASGHKEKERLIAEGEQLKAKILEQAKANIDYETKLAKDAIRAEAVEAAMQMAEDKIRQRLSREDQDKLLSDSFKKLEARN
ncbi:MAG: ATP synthase F0 subunit B [Dissulfurispiraceae bacterium]|jgi:F-type H+-transporting ATPase subunit b|nr:ATP synthase F0 subunit B [Dissulfurispiraceae bacterium]